MLSVTLALAKRQYTGLWSQKFCGSFPFFYHLLHSFTQTGEKNKRKTIQEGRGRLWLMYLMMTPGLFTHFTESVA